MKSLLFMLIYGITARIDGEIGNVKMISYTKATKIKRYAMKHI